MCSAVTSHMMSPGADPGGGPGGPGPPLTTKNEAPAPKLRPQNGSFRPVTIWGPPPDQILDLPLVTVPFKDVMSENKMTRFGHGASKAHPPKIA